MSKNTNKDKNNDNGGEREDTGKLLELASEMLEKSKVLKATAIWLDVQVSKCCKEIDNELEKDDKSWVRVEELYKNLTELEGRLIQVLKDLGKLDEECRKLIDRINKAYGAEVVKQLEPLDIKKMIEDFRNGIDE